MSVPNMFSDYADRFDALSNAQELKRAGFTEDLSDNVAAGSSLVSQLWHDYQDRFDWLEQLQDETPSGLFSDIDTLRWFDIQDTSSLTESYDSVSEVRDQKDESLKLTQDNGGDTPNFRPADSKMNGYDSIQFWDDFMHLSPSVTGVRAVFMVASNFGGSKEGTLSGLVSPVLGQAGTPGDDHVFVSGDGTGGYNVSLDGSGGSTGKASSNGGPLVSGTNIDLGIPDWQVDHCRVWYLEFDTPQTFHYVARLDSETNYYIGGMWLGELVLLDYVPDNTTRDSKIAAMMNKWGITA